MHRKLVNILLLLALVMAPGATLLAAEEDGSATVHDPMQPSWLRGTSEARRQAARPVRQRYAVDTIVVSPERRIAVINGQSVKVGDRVDGAKVMRIDPDAVTLDRNGSRITVSLAVSDIKKETNDGG